MTGWDIDTQVVWERDNQRNPGVDRSLDGISGRTRKKQTPGVR